ncbi:hypothetical protein G7Z17_g8791 [Cylindrodendrum hubeiense]|uniref:WSC domain-containing protein n=1 Tax=Cylindrodendrum hubeiense TaxID=595255 RepID=A0A9P5H7X4_9HYPO|nr:hypothetical protein G7Z17_g8791 [Cylindrodendrum hubeiense]
MSRSILLTGLMAAGTLAQTIPGFQYVGCAKIDRDAFAVGASFTIGPTAEQCQKVCEEQSKSWAALSGGQCLCDDPSTSNHVEYTKVDESLCDSDCVPGDSSQGHCGGGGYSGLPRVYSLYKKDGADDPEEEDCPDEDEEDDEEDDEGEGENATEEDASVVWKVIHECPPEVVDCPYRKKPVVPEEPHWVATNMTSGCPGGCTPPDATKYVKPPPSHEGTKYVKPPTGHEGTKVVTPPASCEGAGCGGEKETQTGEETPEETCVDSACEHVIVSGASQYAGSIFYAAAAAGVAFAYALL